MCTEHINNLSIKLFLSFLFAGKDKGEAYKKEFRSRVDPAVNRADWTRTEFDESRSFRDSLEEESPHFKSCTNTEKSSQSNIENTHFHGNSIAADDDVTSSHDDCDTWVFPLIQMNQFGINIDEGVTQRLWRDAPEQTQIFLASGYLNFPSHYENVILNECSAVFNIITAHPEVSLPTLAIRISSYWAIAIFAIDACLHLIRN